jgi:hypothetical protein
MPENSPVLPGGVVNRRTIFYIPKRVSERAVVRSED